MFAADVDGIQNSTLFVDCCMHCWKLRC